MPNLPPGQVTLGVLRRLVSRETDQPTPTDDTNAEIEDYDDFINRSYRLVIGLLVDSFQDYFINPPNGNPFTFLTTNGTWLYPLPGDFFKLLRMDCLQQPDNIQSAVTMRNFMNLESNRFQGWVQPPPQIWVPNYRITGNLIELQPKPPQSGLQIVVHYVPVLPDMADRGFITFDDVPEVGNVITIAAQSTLPQAAPVNGVLPALTSQIAYVAIANNATPVDTATEVQFRVGTTANEAAANLLDAMQRQATNVPWSTGSAAQDRSVATLSVSGNTLTLQFTAPLAIVWSSATVADSTTPAGVVNLDPLPVASQWNPYAAWTNFCTILNGFDELVIVDAAMKILQKQKQDVSVLESRWGQLWANLRTQANNRNAAQNARITRTRARRTSFFGWGWR